MNSGWATTHHACEMCSSSDGASTNHDGWTTCFSCGERYKSGGNYNNVIDINSNVGVSTMEVGRGNHQMIRSISKSTCARYGIMVDGQDTIFEYRDKDSMVCAQKVRMGSKDNQRSFGVWADGLLFGQHLFPKGGRYLTITEGEFDAASVYQMSGSKYASVSIKNGAQSALKDCKAQYEWIDSFDNVIICFDSDEAGQTAAKEVASLFAGKARIVKHHPDFKDANDYLENSRSDDFKSAWWSAEIHTPDGIIAGKTLWDSVNQPVEKASVQYPWNGLNDLTYGVRHHELVTLTAGSGVGKSQVMREILYHVLRDTESNIGCIFLEESVAKTAKSLMSLHANKRLHLPTVESTEEERRDAFNATLGTDRLFFYDHFGSTSVENIVGQVRYLSKAHDCKYVFLDHLSIIVSAQENGDERKAIDEVMTRLRMLVQETGIALFLVSHLRRPSGKGHEEGASTSLADLRGSASIAQLSDIVLGFERNGQAECIDERNKTYIRVLKNRFSGETGLATAVGYDQDTGRMTEVIIEGEVL